MTATSPVATAPTAATVTLITTTRLTGSRHRRQHLAPRKPTSQSLATGHAGEVALAEILDPLEAFADQCATWDAADFTRYLLPDEAATAVEELLQEADTQLRRVINALGGDR